MPTLTLGELEIHYVEAGEGETLLIFPDNLHASSARAAEIEYFADRFHVLSFDYPGRGGSIREKKYPDEQEYDLWGFWADLACHVLMALDIKGVYAMGTNGGALVALHFAGKQARDHHLEVKGVVADSFLARQDSRTMHRALDVREHYYVRNAKSLQRQHGDDWRDVVAADTAVLRQMADRGGYELFDFILNAIPCPVLLMGHQQDAATPGIAREYARISRIIPDCALYLSSRSNHPHIERPFMRSDPETFRKMADLFFSQIREGD